MSSDQHTMHHHSSYYLYHARVLVLDPIPVMTYGLNAIFEASPMSVAMASVSDAPELLRLVRQGDYDAAIIDINLTGSRDGFAVLKQLHDERPRLPVLVFSELPEVNYGVRAFRLGASGYLSKFAQPAQICQALSALLAGHRYVSDALAQTLANEVADKTARRVHDQLSNRELQILRLLAEGDRPPAIARNLKLSIKTIHTHRRRMFAKLGLESDAEVRGYAYSHGLINCRRQGGYYSPQPALTAEQVQ